MEILTDNIRDYNNIIDILTNDNNRVYFLFYINNIVTYLLLALYG